MKTMDQWWREGREVIGRCDDIVMIGGKMLAVWKRENTKPLFTPKYNWEFC